MSRTLRAEAVGFAAEYFRGAVDPVIYGRTDRKWSRHDLIMKLEEAATALRAMDEPPAPGAATASLADRPFAEKGIEPGIPGQPIAKLITVPSPHDRAALIRETATRLLCAGWGSTGVGSTHDARVAIGSATLIVDGAP